MKTLSIQVFLFLIPLFSFGQLPNQNFDFEKNTFTKFALPDGWFHWGKGFTLTLDSTQKHSGKYSVLIHEAGNKTEDDFGCIAKAIPANYNAEKITAKVWMKLDKVKNGNVGLLLRIDGESSTLVFDNMDKENIQGTSDWKQYSVTLPYPKNAKAIYIGGLNSGTGKLWVDDFEVLLDGKEIKTIKVNEQESYEADKDNEFAKGSEIENLKTDEAKVNGLVVLGKVWGFLKYYHPAIRKGKYNWDNELFRFLPKFVECETQDTRNELLLKWINGLGEVNPASVKQDLNSTMHLTEDFNWINEAEFGKSVCTKLNEIKTCEKGNDSYYVSLSNGVRNPQFKNEKSYPDMKFPDAGYRLLSVYRYWNIIEYYFPYKNLITENRDSLLKAFIPQFSNSMSEIDYKLVVLKLIATTHDTHANIWGLDYTLAHYKGDNYAAPEINFVESKAVVVGYYNTTFGKLSGLVPGDVILKVNSKTIEEIIKEKLPITPASNYTTQLRDIATGLLRTNDSLLNIEYLHNDSIKHKTIQTYRLGLLRDKNQKEDTCFKILKGNIAYLYPESLKQGDMKKLISKIKNTKGLVVDLRCYPGEFIVFSLGEFLLPEKKQFVKFSHASTEMPGYFFMEDPLELGTKNADNYKGKVIILINEKTQSQAEYTTMALRTTPNAIVIGSTTAAADGNVSEFKLPGGITTMISGLGVFYPDGKPTQCIGIIPDIELKPTIKGIKEGRDELLEKAILEINR